MTEAQYYTAPSAEVFQDIKQAAINIWETYDDQFGYATQKINAIKDLPNVRDNAWYMVAMFDHCNKMRLMENVSRETRLLITDALSSE